jgi:beta-glucan synthesis-associated protein KRE6
LTIPTSYDSCDVGTLPNQTLNGEPAIAATAGGNPKYNENLSWTKGQRLSCVCLLFHAACSIYSSVLPIIFKCRACTCPGEDHPGPNPQTGRASPEIDIFEAQKNKQGTGGRVSQSVQMAPFSNLYYFPNTSADVTINNPDSTHLNSYRCSSIPFFPSALSLALIALYHGSHNVVDLPCKFECAIFPLFPLNTGMFRQQAISALTDLNSTTFAEGGAQFTKFGIEYWSDPNNRQNGFINWIADQPVFRIDANTFSGDPTVNISNRLIPEEPLVDNYVHSR